MSLNFSTFANVIAVVTMPLFISHKGDYERNYIYDCKDTTASYILQDNILFLTQFNKMKLSERIRALVEYSGLSIPKYSQLIGVQTPQAIRDLINGKTKSLSADMQTKILSYSPEINPSWLFTGEGEMLRATTPTQKATPDFNPDFKKSTNTLVPLINIDSVGGMEGHNTEVVGEEFIEALIPFPDARPNDWAIHQSGESMAPAIPSGAILQIRQVVDWQEYFGYGNVYVLWLKDDRRITKLIKKYDPDPQNYVLCCSYHPDFADEELPRKMIRQVWKVVNVLINKGW